MSQAIVEHIVVKEIESLSEEDRDLLEKCLKEIDEAKWKQEAAEVRNSN